MLNLKISTVIIEKDSDSLKELHSILKKIDELTILGISTLEIKESL